MKALVEKALTEISKGRSLKRVLTNLANEAQNWTPERPDAKVIQLRLVDSSRPNRIQASVDQHTGRKNVEAVFEKGELVDVRII